jgi:hypothetical protein
VLSAISLLFLLTAERSTYYGHKNHVYSADVFLPVRRGAMVERVRVRGNREKEWHVWARRRCNDRI